MSNVFSVMTLDIIRVGLNINFYAEHLVPAFPFRSLMGQTGCDSKRYTKQTIWGLFDVKMLLVVLVEHLFLVWHEKIIISIEKSTLQAFQHNWYRCANPLKLLISKPGGVSWFSPVYRYRFNIFCSVTKILQSLLYFDKFILFFTFIDPYPAFEILEVQQYRKLASISGVKKKDPI